MSGGREDCCSDYRITMKVDNIYVINCKVDCNRSKIIEMARSTYSSREKGWLDYDFNSIFSSSHEIKALHFCHYKGLDFQHLFRTC